jgi:RNA polymerase sigma factor (TIGR02999 family)
MPEPPVDATQVLAAHQGGDPDASARLLPLVYDELRALAGAYMRRERPDHTLQPTALVHEAYLRLIDITRIDWRGRSHFVAMAATQMRRILVEHARARLTQKRGAAPQRITLNENVAVTPGPTLDLLAFHEALQKLEKESPRQGRVAELRCFAGLEVNEAAYVLGVSETTVKRDWKVARAWLRREIAGDRGGGP